MQQICRRGSRSRKICSADHADQKFGTKVEKSLIRKALCLPRLYNQRVIGQADEIPFRRPRLAVYSVFFNETPSSSLLFHLPSRPSRFHYIICLVTTTTTSSSAVDNRKGKETNLQMARSNVKRRHSDLPHFESVVRISSLPIVVNSIHIAGSMYDKIKRSNSLMSWSLFTAEQSLAIATASAKPAIYALNGPITTIDQLLCKGIDIVEQRVPAIHLPPHLMYCNAREYVNNKIVRPVLMRAGSVKQIGSQAANVAADTLDGALTVADKYVDHYLPADPTDKEEITPSESVSKTTRTIKHGARLSRKLQKRLTRRTLAEARALKEQGTECIHVLLYVVELLATDPKLAYKKAKELWVTLSLPEPENQARPTTLEQLLVLLTRESARRIVHLVNGTAALAARTPRDVGRILIKLSHQLLAVADATLQMMPIVGKKDAAKQQISVIHSAIQRINSTMNHLLEQFAAFLAGRPTVSKITHVPSHQQNHNNHMSMSTNPPLNGIE